MTVQIGFLEETQKINCASFTILDNRLVLRNERGDTIFLLLEE